MKYILENKLDMSKETVSVCKQNSVIIATIPALQSAIDRLEAKNNEIDIALQAQIISIKGITRDKLPSTRAFATRAFMQILI